MKWLNNLLKDAPAQPAPEIVESSGLETAVSESSAAVPEPTSPADIVPAEFQLTDAPSPSPAADIVAAEMVPPPAPVTAAPIQPDLRLDEILQRQQELLRLFESRIHSDEVQGKTLEKLHDELRQYKTNFIRQELMPFFKDVIFCHDFLCNEMSRLQNCPGRSERPGQSPDDDITRSLDHARQMLVDLLFKYDIEPYRGEGDQFDPKLQQCAKTVPTDVVEHDKKLAAAVLPGFKSPDTIVRREQVMVHKYRPPENSSG